MSYGKRQTTSAKITPAEQNERTKENHMDNIIQIRVKDVYGKPTVYPVNIQAHRLAHLVGTKTLTHNALAGAEAMGFTIQEVHDHTPTWGKA